MRSSKTTKLIIISIFVISIIGIATTKKTKNKDKLDATFLSNLMKLESKEDIPTFAKQYNFVPESEHSDFFHNKEIDGTIERLSVDGIYISLNYDTYEKACAASAAMVKANLQEPLLFEYKPYWPEQVQVTSRWTGQGEQSHVSLDCEQYDAKGSSSVGININFTKLIK